MTPSERQGRAPRRSTAGIKPGGHWGPLLFTPAQASVMAVVWGRKVEHAGRGPRLPHRASDLDKVEHQLRYWEPQQCSMDACAGSHCLHWTVPPWALCLRQFSLYKA